MNKISAKDLVEEGYVKKQQIVRKVDIKLLKDMDLLFQPKELVMPFDLSNWNLIRKGGK